ncbi:MAG: c-type cytochrome [Vicinamibacterales bacterium]
MRRILALVTMALAAIGASRTAPRTDQASPPREPPPPATSAGPRSRSVWDGVYTPEQAKRGAAVYHQYCASCHGAQLEGGESAGPLVGAMFTSNWNGVTVGDMFERTRISMPLDRPGTLSRQQNADVLAYMFSANDFPAGKAELARQAELLKQIKFEATKPARD